MKLRISTLFVLAIIASITATGMGAIVYPNVSGPNVSFTQITEDSVTSTLPLFGAPTLIGDKLMFFPTRFASNSVNDQANTTSGTLKLVANALAANAFIQNITIQEFGDWMLTGTGNASANVAGLLTVTDLDTSSVFTAPLTVTPDGPFSLPNNSGQFQAAAAINLPFDLGAGTGTKRAQIVFNNNLQTVAGPGTAAFIQKKVIAGPGVIIVIPEPATMSLLAVGGVLALIRRNRR